MIFFIEPYIVNLLEEYGYHEVGNKVSKTIAKVSIKVREQPRGKGTPGYEDLISKDQYLRRY